MPLVPSHRRLLQFDGGVSRLWYICVGKYPKYAWYFLLKKDLVIPALHASAHICSRAALLQRSLIEYREGQNVGSSGIFEVKVIAKPFTFLQQIYERQKWTTKFHPKPLRTYWTRMELPESILSCARLSELCTFVRHWQRYFWSPPGSSRKWMQFDTENQRIGFLAHALCETWKHSSLPIPQTHAAIVLPNFFSVVQCLHKLWNPEFRALVPQSIHPIFEVSESLKSSRLSNLLVNAANSV